MSSMTDNIVQISFFFQILAPTEKEFEKKKLEQNLISILKFHSNEKPRITIPKLDARKMCTFITTYSNYM